MTLLRQTTRLLGWTLLVVSPLLPAAGLAWLCALAASEEHDAVPANWPVLCQTGRSSVQPGVLVRGAAV